MTRDELYEQIRKKKSFLCVGLDTETDRLPEHLKHREYPLFEFNRQIIDATRSFAVAFKPNVAFYECEGVSGWKQLEMTVAYIRKTYPGILVIADAKRGDIGNTARKYAGAFFGNMDCDAVTVAPYMGADSVLPFLEYPGKWAILLALTSNPGADDFQFSGTGKGQRLFEVVLQKASSWGNTGNLMFVVGATRASLLARVREIVPDHFLLIPGIGAQGGDLGEVAAYGLNSRCGLIVNSSRAIIYAGTGNHFAEAAHAAAQELQVKMEGILKDKGLLIPPHS